MITLTGGDIKKDGVIVQLPRENGSDAAKMLVGFDDTETLRAVKVSADGGLKIDANLSVGSLTVGDVVMTARDQAGVVSYVNRVTNPDTLTSAMYVQDQRFSFTSGRLSVLASGFDGSTVRNLATDNTGKLNVNVISAPATSVSSPKASFVTVPYATTDSMADARPAMSVSDYANKTVVVKNVGANSATVTVMGSVDGGTNYDIYLANNTAITSGSTIVLDENKAMTHILVQARSTVAGSSTNIETRAFAMGA